MDDQVLRLPEAAPVTVRVDRAAKVIGMPLTQAQCAEVFQRLGLQFTQQPGHLTVRPPSWRFDLKIEEDLIEELIRVIGYDQLPLTPPLAPVTARVRPESRRSAHAVRRTLAALDYQETIGFSFVEERWERQLADNPDPIKVLNPIAAPLAVMRSSLVGSLLQVLRTNLARKAGRVRVFEIGRVFKRDAGVPDGPLTVAGLHQPMRVAGLVSGSADGLQWGRKEQGVDFFDVKGVELDGRAVGIVGELHPQWRQAYELPQAPMLFELDLDAVLDCPVPVFTPVPRQQPAYRDVALVLRDDVSHDALMSELRADPASLIRNATLFDIYKPATSVPGLKAGERSLAVRLELLDAETTLTDDRIDAAVAAAVARAEQAFGARLRA